LVGRFIRNQKLEIMSLPTEPRIRTLVLRPGETGVLKANATILTVTKDGSVDATSTCTSIQDAIDRADSMACFRVLFVAEGNIGANSGPFRWDNGDLKIAGITIANSSYGLDDFVFTGFSGDDDARSEAFVTRVQEKLGVNSPIRPLSMKKTGNIGERDEFKFLFKAPSSLGTSVYLTITSPSGGDPDLTVGRFYATLCADCCSESS
jgi:hypothetical protein